MDESTRQLLAQMASGSREMLLASAQVEVHSMLMTMAARGTMAAVLLGASLTCGRLVQRMLLCTYQGRLDVDDWMFPLGLMCFFFGAIGVIMLLAALETLVDPWTWAVIHQPELVIGHRLLSR